MAARADAGKFTQLNNQLNAAMAKLETTVALERKANEDKIALLNRMTEELRQSFQRFRPRRSRATIALFFNSRMRLWKDFKAVRKGVWSCGSRRWRTWWRRSASR